MSVLERIRNPHPRPRREPMVTIRLRGPVVWMLFVVLSAGVVLDLVELFSR